MPVSKAQFRKMAGCLHNPKHMKGSCPSPAVAKEFVEAGKGKYAPLPERTRKGRR